MDRAIEEEAELLAQQQNVSTKGGNNVELTATDWKAVYAVAAVTFIVLLISFILELNRWPYMQEIDKEATLEFFGASSSAGKAGHALFTIIFALWTYKYQCVRPPIVFGSVMAIVGCLLYSCVEMLPSGRRFLMLFCYVLFGAASSCVTVLRAYISCVSLPADRPKAFAFTIVAVLAALIVAPILHMSFTGIEYPGVVLLPNVSVHLYTSPVFVAAAINVVAIVITLAFLKELPKRRSRPEADAVANESSWQVIMTKLRSVAKLEVDWTLVALCWLMKTIITMSFVAFVIMPVIHTTLYGWAGTELVQITSISMGVSGILSLITAIAYAVFGKRLPQRYAFLIGMGVFTAMYTFSLPYPFNSQPMNIYNATTDKGCNPMRYDWCDSARAPPPMLLVSVQTVALSLCLPFVIVSLDATYANVLGNIDQSMLQGAFIIFEDLVFVFGPIIYSLIFSNYGFGTLWTANLALVQVGIIIWTFYLGRLRLYA